MTRDAVLHLFDRLNVWSRTDDASPWMANNPRPAYGDHRMFWASFWTRS